MSRKKIHIKIPAELARKKTLGEGVVEDHVNELIRIIEQDIEDAIQEHKNNIITELGTNFDVPNMNKQDAQRDVYFLLAQALKQAGYSIELIIKGEKNNDQCVYMKVQWTNAKYNEMNKYKDEFLKSISRRVSPPG